MTRRFGMTPVQPKQEAAVHSKKYMYIVAIKTKDGTTTSFITETLLAALMKAAALLYVDDMYILIKCARVLDDRKYATIDPLLNLDFYTLTFAPVARHPRGRQVQITTTVQAADGYTISDWFFIADLLDTDMDELVVELNIPEFDPYFTHTA